LFYFVIYSKLTCSDRSDVMSWLSLIHQVSALSTAVCNSHISFQG